MAKKALPIGISDYKDLIEGNYYYVDKTLLTIDFSCKQDKVFIIEITQKEIFEVKKYEYIVSLFPNSIAIRST
jgi:hypothetical protein